MSHLKQFEVKVMLRTGGTMVTIIYAENDHRARQITRQQYGDQLLAIHSVRELS
jgi:hypothetical protein